MFSYDNTATIYQSSHINIPHGFGTKLTGDGRSVSVIKNLLAKENLSYTSIVIPGQTHSTNVACITSSVGKELVHIPNTDAVVTNQKGVVLTVVTADCVPIIYHDSRAGIIGISHGGWKGTLEKISLKVIEKMIQLGSRKEHIAIAIGPAIGSCCYGVYGERLFKLQTEFDERVFEQRKNKVFIDLKKANVLTVRRSGIPDGQMALSDLCTSCQSEEFFSYKRDGEIRGEMLSFVSL